MSDSPHRAGSDAHFGLDDDWTVGPPRLSRRALRLLVTTFVVMAGATVLALIPLPYVVMQPGPATNTLGMGPDGKPLIQVSGARTYPASGALDFTTVSVHGGPGARVNAWDVLFGWLSSSSEVVDQGDVFPEGVTSEQVEDRNAAQMTESQREAVAVAIRSLGQEVGERYVIAGIGEASAAKGVVEVGDQITAVDGTPVSSVADIQGLIRAHAQGEKVALTVERAGSSTTLQVPTRAVDGVTALGVLLQTDFDFPYEVTIDAGDVGGPSAGTMFALAIRDVLTPGNMTGGKKIAGTGTIDDDGTVGAIGGIRQKVVGAADAGAGYFLAPADNCAELATSIPDDLIVVRVATFDEAVKAVESIASGTGTLPRCPAA